MDHTNIEYVKGVKKKPAFLITPIFEAYLSDDNRSNSFSPKRYVQYGPNKKKP